MTTRTLLPIGPEVLERMVLAVELVRQRLARVTAALEAGNVPYAVIGGNAVAVWVARVDPRAVRNTADVDIMIQRSDLERAKTVLEQAGFYYHETLGVHMFLEHEQSNPRDAVHVLFAGEKVEEKYLAPTPELTETVAGGTFRVLTLEALVQMKLTSFRDKDRTHIRDLIGVGLIDASWPAKYPEDLAARLQQILDNPDG